MQRKAKKQLKQRSFPLTRKLHYWSVWLFQSHSQKASFELVSTSVGPYSMERKKHEVRLLMGKLKIQKQKYIQDYYFIIPVYLII